MRKETVLYFIISVWSGTTLFAQYQLDIAGSARIRGQVDISHSPDTTSVHIGPKAGNLANSSLKYNTYIGNEAGEKNHVGIFNTAVGSGAGRDNTGFGNCFLGSNSGQLNNTGNANTFLGALSGRNSNGSGNTFIGANAGIGNSSGYNNIYLGLAAGFGNALEPSSGFNNIALGIEASYGIARGSNNISLGYRSLYVNDHGDHNIAIGHETLYFNYSSWNVAIGYHALYQTNTGIANTALGNNAGIYNNNSHSTFLGHGATSTTSVSNATALGFNASVDASNKVRIGNNQITVIEGNVAFSPMSDRRLKENIQPVPLGLNFILDLNPVVYNRISNEEKNLEMGLIAQELDSILLQHHSEEVSMINRGGDGYLSVRYNDLLAPMIKAIQEQQEIIERQKMENKILSEKVDFLMNVVTAEEYPKIKHPVKGKKNKTFAVK